MSGCEIGFIGLGAIGMPMALRIVATGLRLTVWGRRPKRLAPALEAGAQAVGSPRELVGRCETICLCLTDADAVEAVVFGPDGIAAAGIPGRLILDHSTIHPQRTRDIAGRLRAEAGMSWVDAPVSGGPVGARAGTLAVMAGGEPADIERARPVLDCFAGRVTHMGGVGAGQATKACNQMISAAAIAGITEALLLASRFGLDTTRLPEAVAGGWADSALLRHYMPRMAAGRFQGSTVTMVKDLDIACDLARTTGTPLPVTALLDSFYRRLVASGQTELGISGLIRLWTELPLPGHEAETATEPPSPG